MPAVLMLSCEDLAVMQAAVSALKREAGPTPCSELAHGDPGFQVTRVAVFIEALYVNGAPAAWRGSAGDVEYSADASYRLLGYVSL